ncbi:DNA helicase, TraI type [uncultured Caudovirales phage]|uniref:DNA helicase, TraI type n=1 Tax=uncultured Caudovirales phage TaxID=2100421 RepID=A0A6J5NAJ1_9CAUD|nr:DNA helicase, TraI type [uncultured Caudovirales phage]
MGSSKAEAPKVPSYSSQMRSALTAQQRIAPQLLALEQQYQPQFTALNLSGLQGALFGTGDQQGYLGTLQQLAPEYRKMEAEDTAALRAEELKQLGQFAPQYVQTFRGAAGSQGLLSGLQQQAEQDLAAGSSLTPEETRQAQQASRAAFAGRGLGLTNRAIGSEILNQYGLGQERLQQRRQFAGQTAAQLEGSGMPQYYQTMMGGGSLQNLMALTGQGQGLVGYNQGSNFFNPESQMAMDISAQRTQGKAAAGAANAANKSAMLSAGAGAAVTVGAVLI